MNSNHSNSNMKLNLRSLNDRQLHEKLVCLTVEERQLTTLVLHHLREVDNRRLYAKFARSSLFEYCVKDLKYSADQSQRRIQAMRALKSLNEEDQKKVETHLQSGELTLTNLAQIQTFARNENKLQGQQQDPKHDAKIDGAAKMHLIQESLEKSTREVEKLLLGKSSAPQGLRPDRVQPLTPTHTEIRFTADEGLLSKIEEVKNLLAHVNPNPTWAELISALADFYLVKKNPLKQETTAEKMTKEVNKEEENNKDVEKDIDVKNTELPIPAPQVSCGTAWAPKVGGGRHVPVALRKAVWLRDQGRCTYISPLTGHQCEAQRELEVDHAEPFAQGGGHEIGNIRILCKQHNLLLAVEAYGGGKMAAYLRS